jgi:hypothetical protein
VEIDDPNTNIKYNLYNTGFKFTHDTNLIGNDKTHILQINMTLTNTGISNICESGDSIYPDINIINNSGETLTFYTNNSENETTQYYRYYPEGSKTILWNGPIDCNEENTNQSSKVRKFIIELPKGDIYKVFINNFTQTWNNNWNNWEEGSIQILLDGELITTDWNDMRGGNTVTNLVQMIHCEGVELELKLKNKYIEDIVEDLENLSLLNYNKYTNKIEKCSLNNKTIKDEHFVTIQANVFNMNKIILGIERKILLENNVIEYYMLYGKLTNLYVNTRDLPYEFSLIDETETNPLINNKHPYDNMFFTIKNKNELYLNNNIFSNINTNEKMEIITKNKDEDRVYVLNIQAKYQFTVIQQKIQL